LVDFENLKPSAADIAQVRGDHQRLWLFHGPHQNKFDAPMVKAWQPLGDRVEFVQSSKQGKNALDFHMAFRLGALYRDDLAAGREARYVVVTGDGGFDALLEHMRSLGCSVGKAASIPAALAMLEPQALIELPKAMPTRPSRGIIPAVKAAPKQPPTVKPAVSPASAQLASGVQSVVDELRAHPRNRPRDRAALERYALTRLGRTGTQELARAVIRQLEQQKIVTFVGKSVEFKIPKAAKPSKGE
jgi:hypothetical protein